MEAQEITTKVFADAFLKSGMAQRAEFMVKRAGFEITYVLEHAIGIKAGSEVYEKALKAKLVVSDQENSSGGSIEIIEFDGEEPSSQLDCSNTQFSTCIESIGINQDLGEELAEFEEEVENWSKKSLEEQKRVIEKMRKSRVKNLEKLESFLKEKDSLCTMKNLKCWLIQLDFQKKNKSLYQKLNNYYGKRQSSNDRDEDLKEVKKEFDYVDPNYKYRSGGQASGKTDYFEQNELARKDKKFIRRIESGELRKLLAESSESGKGKDVTVGIIDTGCAFEHQFFKGKDVEVIFSKEYRNSQFEDAMKLATIGNLSNRLKRIKLKPYSALTKQKSMFVQLEIQAGGDYVQTKITMENYIDEFKNNLVVSKAVIEYYKVIKEEFGSYCQDPKPLDGFIRSSDFKLRYAEVKEAEKIATWLLTILKGNDQDKFASIHTYYNELADPGQKELFEDVFLEYVIYQFPSAKRGYWFDPVHAKEKKQLENEKTQIIEIIGVAKKLQKAFKGNSVLAKNFAKVVEKATMVKELLTIMVKFINVCEYRYLDLKYDSVGHGTAMAASVLAVAPEAKVIFMKKPTTPMHTYFITELLAQKPSIISCSWGADSRTAGRLDKFKGIMEIAATQADKVTFVFSAGNYGGWYGIKTYGPNRFCEIMSFGGQIEEAIGVGGAYYDLEEKLLASNLTNGFKSIKNPNQNVPDVVSLCGPMPRGNYIKLPLAPDSSLSVNSGFRFDNDWLFAAGSSSAGAQVAGLCALVLEENGKLNCEVIKQLLKDTAKGVKAGVGANGHEAKKVPNIATGHGLIQIDKAVKEAARRTKKAIEQKVVVIEE